MTAQPYRLPEGGRIDRSRPLRFTFNDRGYAGYHGDTLASALLANGVTLIGRLLEDGTIGRIGVALERASGVARERPAGF